MTPTDLVTATDLESPLGGQGSTRAKPGAFRKKTYRLPELWRDVKAVRAHARGAPRVRDGARIDAALREEIMVAVARVNGCRGCSFVHQELALASGVPDAEIAQLEGLNPDAFDRGKWVALAYAQALASNDFGEVSAEVHEAAIAVYGHDGRHEIEAVARQMTIANRLGNTVEAFFARRRGHPASAGRIFDEFVITSALFLVLPAFGIWFTAKTRKAPWQAWRDFRRFSREFDGHGLTTSDGTPPRARAEVASGGQNPTRPDRTN